LFTDSKIDVYQPEIEQVTEYNTGKNRAEVESFLVLGFGGRGHDLLKSFDVSYGGTENIGGVQAAKLTLAPKTAKVRNMFAQIILWIDPARGVSVQQQLVDPDGNYRLAKYSDIRLNQKIPDSVFKLKTTGKTRWVRPQQTP
jgi:outer membrane lipoprotein-sorting protein